MVLCLVALVVFGILGIFSAKYRALAKEAFSCVFRMATFRKCESSFDSRMKAGILSKLSRWPRLAKLIYKNFDLLSWVFTILFFLSLILLLQGVYYYLQYGNCNGPNSTAFCIFSSVTGKQLTAPSGLDGISLSNASGSPTLFMFGCFTCQYTKAAWPGVKAFLAAHPQIHGLFKTFPLPTHAFSTQAAQAAFCADKQGKFMPYADALFENQTQVLSGGTPVIKSLAAQVGLNTVQFSNCLDSNATLSQVETNFNEGIQSGVYGTPTFFLQGRSAVGPMSEGNFEDLLAGRQVTPNAPVDEAVCPRPSEVG